MSARYAKTGRETPPLSDVTKRSSSRSNSPSDDSSREYTEQEKEAYRLRRRAEKTEHFRRTFSVWKLVDPSQPWVLVEKGSFLGFFDWVPEKLRVGPWSLAAFGHVFALFYLAALASAYYMSSVRTSSISPELATSYLPTSSVLEAWTTPWYYHVAAFGWMNYINYIIAYRSPLGLGAWSTYTVQSWTLLMVRHGMCLAASFWPTARLVADWIRFPVVCSATITFVVWNFILFPGVYFVMLKKPTHRLNFYNFCTSFRLLNLHGLNIFLAAINCGTWADPPSRALEWFPDFYLAALSAVMYLAWYFFVLDRLGIHLYPIFSPRAPAVMVLGAAIALLALYLSVFITWRDRLQIVPY